MPEKNRRDLPETETAFTLCIFLTNFLILLILVGAVWLMHSTVAANSELSIFLRGGMLP